MTESIHIVLTSKQTSWKTNFTDLYLDPKKQYEIALMDLETYHSIPNINESNNSFVLINKRNNAPIEFMIPTGSYEITQLNEYITQTLERLGLGDAGIKVTANIATFRSIIHIAKPQDYEVDMARSTIRTVLGFDPRMLTAVENVGDSVVNILSVNSILVTCDLVGGSYLNGTKFPVLYSFFPNASPGHKIIEKPHNLVYLPITKTGNVNQLAIGLLDQDENQLDLRGETVTIRLHIRSI